MNILFVSELKNKSWAGTHYSVPNQVSSISKIENVFWININNEIIEEWEKLDYYDSIRNYKKNSINSLKEPFNKPDIIIFEEFYVFRNYKFIKSVIKSGIPYIIIPRSQLTLQCYNRKKIKKIIGNIFFYNQFKRKATAVQYLSENEALDSSKCYKGKSYIIANGLPNFVKKIDRNEITNKDKIIFTYIGRMDVIQKGLDLLFSAVSKLDDDIRGKILINLYGPIYKDNIPGMINEYNISDFVFFKGPVYGDEKDKVLIQSDIFIMTSRYEGMPMGLLEALNYSLPCLITTGTNMCDEVKKFDCGWTCDNSIDGIYNSILNVIDNMEQYKKKSENAYTLSLQYSWDDLAIKTSEQLKKIINK